MLCDLGPIFVNHILEMTHKMKSLEQELRWKLLPLLTLTGQCKENV